MLFRERSDNRRLCIGSCRRLSRLIEYVGKDPLAFAVVISKLSRALTAAAGFAFMKVVC